jgi:hypothetical protein
VIPTPARLIDAVTRHHRPRFAVTGPSGSWPVTEGSLELTRTSLPHTLAQASIAQLTGNPTSVAAEFQPFGSTATVTWQVDPWPDVLTLAEGLPVVVSTVTRPDSLVRVKLQDPAAIISKHTLSETEPVTPPTTVLTACQTLLQRTYPTHTVTDPTGAGAATPVPEDWRQTDPWQGMMRAAQAAALTPVYTGANTVTLLPEPGTSGPIVDTLTVTEHIIDYTVTYERAYSRVLLAYDDFTGRWDATSGPLVGLPPSTYYEKRQGPIGSQATADAAAAAWADRAAGRVASLELTCIPRPWLQPGDRVAVTLLNNTTSRAIIDRVTLPFNGDPMRLTMRNSDYIGPAEY